jgi:hypothetical protein
VQADLVVDRARGQLPDLFGVLAVLGVGHHHVGRQPVREGAHLARGAAGAGLAGQAEGAVARLADLARQQVDVVDHVVGPGAARVLVEAHGPQAHDLGLRVGVGLGQVFQLLDRHARQRADLLGGVVADELGELVEADRRAVVGVALGLAVGAG